MSLALADAGDQIAFTAELCRSTHQSLQGYSFSARPPLPSPFGALKADRNSRMLAMFLESVADAEDEPNTALLESVEAFLKLLPGDLPATEPYVTAHGSIAFDWDSDPDLQLSILLQGESRIAFMALMAGERIHGTANFSGKELPARLASTASSWASLRQRRLQQR